MVVRAGLHPGALALTRCGPAASVITGMTQGGIYSTYPEYQALTCPLRLRHSQIGLRGVNHASNKGTH